MGSAPIEDAKFSLRDHLLGGLAAIILRGLAITWRFQLVIDVSRSGEAPPVALGFWHDRQLMMAAAYRRLNWRKILQDPVYVLVSKHRDGRLIARAIRSFGIHSVAGSSTSGASAALRALIRVVKNHCTAVITPDGPRGPAFRAKPGILHVARAGQVPILPLGLAVDRCWRFRSWDRLILPKPFARIMIVIGDFLLPESLGGREEESDQIKRVDETLNSLTNRAERLIRDRIQEEPL